jgi:CubicO group peptidase (beta-lactamase class C family)
MNPTKTRTIATLAAGVLLSSVLAAPAADTLTTEKVEAALPRMAAYAASLIERGVVPGMAIGVVYQDEVVYLGGFGVRAMGGEEPVDADTVFQLASFSKPMAAATVAAIVGGGTITWDSRIADLDPGFRLHDPYPSAELTLRDLFSHRSGLPGLAGNELESLGFDRDTILHRLRYVAPASSFRSKYSYSNFGLTEGGVAAARAVDMSWEEAAETFLYKPLGMTSTSSRYADFLTRQNRATLHSWYEGRWQALTTRMPDAQSPAGGASSNVRDLAQWMRLELGRGKLDGRQVVDAAALAATHVPVISKDKATVTGSPEFYCLGWTLTYGPRGVQWAHAGAFSVGAHTLISLLPDSGLGIIVLSNAHPTGAPEAVASTFFDLAFDGEASRDWLPAFNQSFSFAPAIEAAKAAFATPPSPPTPALPLAAYAGTYANDFVGEAVVAEENGGLVVKMGPGGAATFPLIHFDRDIFIYYPTPEWPDVPVAVTFAIGPDGKAATVAFEDLDASAPGGLRRIAD